MDDTWVDYAGSTIEELNEMYPGLNAEKTSDFDPFYNCTAWAIGDKGNIWAPGAYWPPGGTEGESVDDLVATYRNFGFKPCGMDDSLDPTYEKIAICAVEGRWEHACKQLEDGKWSSKFGDDIDVKHDLYAIESVPAYGKVVLIVRRARKPLPPETV